MLVFVFVCTFGREKDGEGVQGSQTLTIVFVFVRGKEASKKKNVETEERKKKGTLEA